MKGLLYVYKFGMEPYWKTLNPSMLSNHCTFRLQPSDNGGRAGESFGQDGAVRQQSRGL